LNSSLRPMKALGREVHFNPGSFKSSLRTPQHSMTMLKLLHRDCYSMERSATNSYTTIHFEEFRRRKRRLSIHTSFRYIITTPYLGYLDIFRSRRIHSMTMTIIPTMNNQVRRLHSDCDERGTYRSILCRGRWGYILLCWNGEFVMHVDPTEQAERG